MQRNSFKSALGGGKEASTLCKESSWDLGHSPWCWVLPSGGKGLAVSLSPPRATASLSPPLVCPGMLCL